jgi:hypothetical protein
MVQVAMRRYDQMFRNTDEFTTIVYDVAFQVLSVVPVVTCNQLTAAPGG